MTVLPDSHPPLPLTVIGGYLGAGKTTLVNVALAGDHGLRIAVLVNDFGSVAIDEALIAGRDGDVVALSNGCMCCQIGGDLYDAIDRILRMRDRFDHLLIETSGVADPGKVAQIAIAEPELEAAQTIVLVDALNFKETLDDPRLNDTLLRQVRAADIIFVSKTEMATASFAEIEAHLTGAGAGAPAIPLSRGDREAWRLFLVGDRGKWDVAAGDMKAERLGFHSLPFESWSWQGTDLIEGDDLLAFAHDTALAIYRLKGRLHLRDGRTILIHKVGQQVEIEDHTGPVFVKSELVAIGAKPDFDPTRTQIAWMRLLVRACLDG